MSKNLLDQLAAREIPPLPEEFDRQIHERLNANLLVTHLADLLLRALPWACVHFGCTVIGAIGFTLTGKYPSPRPRGEQDKYE